MWMQPCKSLKVIPRTPGVSTTVDYKHHKQHRNKRLRTMTLTVEASAVWAKSQHASALFQAQLLCLPKTSYRSTYRSDLRESGCAHMLQVEILSVFAWPSTSRNGMYQEAQLDSLSEGSTIRFLLRLLWALLNTFHSNDCTRRRQ